MPMVTSAIEVRATAHDSSPSARQAAMPVTTAPTQASPQPRPNARAAPAGWPA